MPFLLSVKVSPSAQSRLAIESDILVKESQVVTCKQNFFFLKEKGEKSTLTLPHLSYLPLQRICSENQISISLHAFQNLCKRARTQFYS